ncbi:MAG: amylo-alpha-1,6-glucosidase, partial [Flavobacterium sp.]
MDKRNWTEIEQAKSAALQVLLHNVKGPFQGLPRTAAWGYPEPYTRDLMISILGVAVSKNQELIQAMQKTLQVLSENQS